MKRLTLTLATGALCSGVLAFHGFAAEDVKPAAVARKIVEKHDQSGVKDKEILLGTATFPAGGTIGAHSHPGDEIGYVLTGSGTIKSPGQPDRPLKAGDSYFNARGLVHQVVAGADGATIVSTWIVDKGVPMATPVP